jgi:hypothetical protein
MYLVEPEEFHFSVLRKTQETEQVVQSLQVAVLTMRVVERGVVVHSSQAEEERVEAFNVELEQLTI